MNKRARTRIKICGVRDQETAEVACEAGADAIGFMFASFSPRYIEPEAAAAIMLNLPPFVATVGVFVNPEVDAFCDLEEICPTTHTQLHGNEGEVDLKRFGPAIKAVRYQPDTIAAELKRWDANEDVDSILVDGSAGGEGVSLDWNQLRTVLDEVDPVKPIILAGGLNPSNVARAIEIVCPFGVDVSSGVERAKGEKDPELIRAFCEAVRRADLSLG